MKLSFCSHFQLVGIKYVAPLIGTKSLYFSTLYTQDKTRGVACMFLFSNEINQCISDFLKCPVYKLSTSIYVVLKTVRDST